MAILFAHRADDVVAVRAVPGKDEHRDARPQVDHAQRLVRARSHGKVGVAGAHRDVVDCIAVTLKHLHLRPIGRPSV